MRPAQMRNDGHHKFKQIQCILEEKDGQNLAGKFIEANKGQIQIKFYMQIQIICKYKYKYK